MVKFCPYFSWGITPGDWKCHFAHNKNSRKTPIIII